MDKRLLSVLIASLFVAAPAHAQSDEFRTEGSITAGGIVSSTNDTKDASKLQEYQDLSNGMLSNIWARGRNSRSWFDAYGENFGRDDMYVDIRGGMYGLFKGRAYTNWIPHNLLFNGITPYTGSGSANLTGAFPNPNPANWNPLNLGYERKDTGGLFEWQGYTPWYFRVDGNQVKTTGTKVGSAALGTSPGNGFADLAFPVQYETNNVSVEGGYATNTMTFNVSYLSSNFGNSNETLRWTNPFFGNAMDTTWLAPDNSYQRIALNGVIRQLPGNSTLAARYTWDQTKSETTLASFALNGTGSAALGATNPDVPTFNGNEKRQTFTLGLSSTPITNVDTRLYFNWQKMNNDSTQVTFNPIAGLNCGGGVCENDLWHYEKENAGAEAYWRINRANRLSAGYDYFHMTQNRLDYDDTDQNTFWVEWRNSSLDTLSGRLKYSYIQRRSNFLLSNAGANANDPVFLERFVQRFDLSDLNQNRVKLILDWSPSDAVGVAVEAIWKDNNYTGTTLGRTKDKRGEIFANLTYGTPSSWRATLFGDYESVKYYGSHRYVGAGTCPTTSGGTTANNCFDPSTPPNSIAYNWTDTNKQDNWMVGLGIDFPVSDLLMLTGSLIYGQVDGSADMSAQQNFGNPLPLTQYPDSKTTTLNLKGVYRFNKNWSVTGGYAFQKYEYSDNQFIGYQNTIPFPGVSNNTAQSYLNNWNAFIPYTSNIFYLLATLRF